MALASIQASYDDDDNDDDDDIEHETNTIEEEANDRMAVITDPTFSVMSKIKLNLTPAIAIQVRKIVLFLLIHFFFFSSQQIQVVFSILKLEKFYTILNMMICMHRW